MTESFRRATKKNFPEELSIRREVSEGYRGFWGKSYDSRYEAIGHYEKSYDSRYEAIGIMERATTAGMKPYGIMERAFEATALLEEGS